MRLAFTGSQKLVHIVYLGHNDGLNASLTASLHLQLLSGVFTRSDEARDAILYSYSYGFSGFAAMLNSTQAAKLSEAEEVISIFRSRMLEIHTTRSWDFMGLSLHIQNEQSAGMQLKYGDDIIVGILDTGGLEAKQTVIPAARRAYIPKQTFAFCQSLLSSRLLLPSAASPTAPAPALPVQALLTTAGLLPHHPDLSLVALNSLLRVLSRRASSPAHPLLALRLLLLMLSPASPLPPPDHLSFPFALSAAISPSHGNQAHPQRMEQVSPHTPASHRTGI
uniref:Subtilase n=2 Tax=Oryza sativa subsp. japonica TaxID=39947 RepID=Q10RH5_ORYSJ|nr:Putative subtilase [Oryza sativa Japonica Group]ABF94083.1 Subtilisin N-terminal Region family protein [Oryza sativa Japonica Group]